MTRAEAIQTLQANAKLLHFEHPHLGIKEAIEVVIEALSQPSLPSGLDEAAEEYGYINWQSEDYHEGASEGLPFDAIDRRLNLVNGENLLATELLEETKGMAAELLSLARKQLIKDGYVIEKKAFHDAVENISDKHLAEMSIQYYIHCKVEDGTRHAIMNWDTFQKVAQKFIDIGKAEALRDMPRWREWDNGACGNSEGHPIALVSGAGGIRFVSLLGVHGEKYIMLDDLKKLPGFEED